MLNGFVNRRRFLWSTYLLAAAKLVFTDSKWLERATVDQEFLIINGWVLTREDFLTGKNKRDVV